MSDYSVAQSCLTLQTNGLQHARLLCPLISQSLLKFMPIKSVMASNHLVLCCPLLLLPSIFSSIRVFSNESTLHIRWPEYWSFSFSVSPSNKYSGLISLTVLSRLGAELELPRCGSSLGPSQYRLASTRRQPASSLPRSGHWAPNLGPK